MGPIRRLRFTKATQRHASIRENEGLSLGKFHVKIPHQRSPYAMIFEDRSQEEIERQERCARGDAWRLAKNILKLTETDKAAFFSPTNGWCIPAPPKIKPEEREFVVDSGTSMHMLRREDLNSPELETVKISRNPITVVTANGEVHTKEAATVNVKDLDLFVTVKLLEDTPADLSLGKLSDEHGYSYHWALKMAGALNATRRTTSRSWSLVYRQTLQVHLHLHLQHLHRRKQKFLGSIPH